VEYGRHVMTKRISQRRASFVMREKCKIQGVSAGHQGVAAANITNHDADDEAEEHGHRS